MNCCPRPCGRDDGRCPSRSILNGMAGFVVILYFLCAWTLFVASEKPGAGQAEAIARDEAKAVADARAAGLLSLVAREKAAIEARLDSLERHDAELARMSHERRAALADELRREFGRELGVLRDIVEADRIAAADRATADGLQAVAIGEELRREILAMGRSMTQAEGDCEVARLALGEWLRDLDGRIRAAESKPRPGPPTVPTTPPLPGKNLPEAGSCTK